MIIWLKKSEVWKKFQFVCQSEVDIFCNQVLTRLLQNQSAIIKHLFDYNYLTKSQWYEQWTEVTIFNTIQPLLRIGGGGVLCFDPTTL